MGKMSKDEWEAYIARIQAECAAGQAEGRREYRRQWMASKRARERACKVPSRVELELPVDAKIQLVKGRPSEQSWSQYLSALILKGLGGPISDSALKTRSGPSLNQRCRCGSGRKWKKCCGAAPK
jgi:hypothetical protein